MSEIASAAEAGYAERIREILQRDASAVNVPNTDGWTPLHLAAFYGRREAAQVLLDHGADVAAVSTNDMANQPLHAAAAGRHLELVELLLAHGADPNAQQHGGWTPLQAAAQHGDAAMTRVLLAHGADVEALSDDGRNAIDLATAAGHDEVVELLRRDAAPQ
jgi:ankyrin repeat protein